MWLLRSLTVNQICTFYFHKFVYGNKTFNLFQQKLRFYMKKIIKKTILIFRIGLGLFWLLEESSTLKCSILIGSAIYRPPTITCPWIQCACLFTVKIWNLFSKNLSCGHSDHCRGYQIKLQSTFVFTMLKCFDCKISSLDLFSFFIIVTFFSTFGWSVTLTCIKNSMSDWLEQQGLK